MLGDTILAQATADGAGERAIVRLSGPAARAVAAPVFAPALPEQRGQAEGTLRIRDRDVPALALVMPGPRSFTGEDVVELHLPGSPLLVAGLRDDLLARGAEAGVRLAQPGEFTARACANGRLDLAQAEGLLMVLHAADRRALATSAQWLRGGMSEALAALRERLGDALALLESGLDFEAGETGTVAESEVEALLAPAGVRIAELRAALPAAAPGGEVLLLGAANAGKSSLCNALARRAGTATRELLVDAVAGTTRDLVRVPLGASGEGAGAHGVGEHGVREYGAVLWDAPGDLDEPAAWDAAALQLRDRLAGRAAAALAVIDATAPRWPATGGATDLPWLAVVITKADASGEEPAAIERAVLAALPRRGPGDRRGPAEDHDECDDGPRARAAARLVAALGPGRDHGRGRAVARAAAGCRGCARTRRRRARARSRTGRGRVAGRARGVGRRWPRSFGGTRAGSDLRPVLPRQVIPVHRSAVAGVRARPSEGLDAL